MGSQWSDVISPQEVATLGALCSLASFTRPELKAKVVENVNMREFLELVPEVPPFHSPRVHSLSAFAYMVGKCTFVSTEHIRQFAVSIPLL